MLYNKEYLQNAGHESVAPFNGDLHVYQTPA